MCKNIVNEFLLKEDMEVIRSWAYKKNASISFRMAGDKTLKCLERGAGAKPHEILDKTLKFKSGSRDKAITHNEAVNKFFKIASDVSAGDITEEQKKVLLEAWNNKAEDLLMGLVGHWNDNDEVDGLYLTDLGVMKFSDTTKWTTGNNKYGKTYLVLNDVDKLRLMAYYSDLMAEYEKTDKEKEKKKALYFFTRLFFSGDYDVHDLLQAGYPVPTELDKKMMKELQQDLSKARKVQLKNHFELIDSDFTGEVEQDYYRVQHGSQFNYTAQMINENKQCKDIKELNILVNSVANMDPPVMMYDDVIPGTGWKILENNDMVENYYEKTKGLKLKGTWRDQKERDKHIKWVIRNAIDLRFPDAKSREKIDIALLGKEMPGFKNSGIDFEGYANAVLDDMVKKGIIS